REGSVARDLDALLPLVTPTTQHRFCFCTDDCQPADLVDRGGIDHMVRRAVAGGLDPIMAIRLATWNAAQYFRLHNRGAITPGRRADLVVFDDLQAPAPRLVFRNGQLVAQDGRMAVPPRPPSRTLRGTMNVAWDAVDFRIPAEGRCVRVIGVVADQLVTRALVDEPPVVDGLALAAPERDLLKIAVIERHMASGAMGKGFVRGIGLRRGALASSVAHDHHNIVVIGADDGSMMTAARRVAAMQGGMVVAEGDTVIADVPLPLGGLMSHEPVETVREQVATAVAAARGLGSPLHDPFMMMSFLALEVIPSLKLTDKGLVDVDRFEHVPLWMT
ncbi:MAG: adenine deaminase C-terminal domain-containing protein, partial [Vicinamibacterales bacterium]|nr:adenine deaminase C-terminal domain-containing protein [Vicinamibacterales bacterium]